MVLPDKQLRFVVMAAAAAAVPFLLLLGSSVVRTAAEGATKPLSARFQTYGIDSPSVQEVKAKPGETVEVELSGPLAVLHKWEVMGVTEAPQSLRLEGPEALEAAKAAVRKPEDIGFVVSAIKVKDDNVTRPGGSALWTCDVKVGDKTGTFGVVFGFINPMEPSSDPRLFLLKVEV